MDELSISNPILTNDSRAPQGSDSGDSFSISSPVGTSDERPEDQALPATA